MKEGASSINEVTAREGVLSGLEKWGAGKGDALPSFSLSCTSCWPNLPRRQRAGELGKVAPSEKSRKYPEGGQDILRQHPNVKKKIDQSLTYTIEWEQNTKGNTQIHTTIKCHTFTMENKNVYKWGYAQLIMEWLWTGPLILRIS